ncbi:MAG: ATPase, partial [Lachnospiraceae bacterium]|nr:ATPase [Lachnospiraceae bacterium]
QDIEKRYIDTFENLKIVLPESDLAAIYDNTIEFRRFAIYKNGKPIRISHNVPIWYERFTADMG